MLAYVRPSIVVEEYLDDDGTVIPYGSRWLDNDRDGPEDTYSVTKHPERFQPLVDVAHAIIDHLVATYDVEREDPDDLTVVLWPHEEDVTTLTFTFTPFPSVRVAGGASPIFQDMCGCDHCDEDVIGLIQSLEEAVAGVVAGQFIEWTSGYELRHADGSEWQVLEGPDGGGQRSRRHYRPWSVRSR